MSFFAILLALVLEQARPLSATNVIFAAIKHWVTWIARTFDAGLPHHAWITWGITVIGPAVLTMLAHWSIEWGLGWFFAVIWNVALLYVTLGFRQFSHHFTNIRAALENGDEDQARTLLANWKQVKVGQIPGSEIVRHVIEFSMISAHRHVFGVFFWYAILSIMGLGPLGAVVYRLAELVQRRWSATNPDGSVVSTALRGVASSAWLTLDWLPSRMTALGFAIVGSFEDAMDGWRQHAQNYPHDNDGVILAATAGAINIRLGGPVLQQHGEDQTPGTTNTSSNTTAPPPELAHLTQVVGLVWRTVIMWLLLLALLTMANLMG